MLRLPAPVGVLQVGGHCDGSPCTSAGSERRPVEAAVPSESSITGSGSSTGTSDCGELARRPERRSSGVMVETGEMCRAWLVGRRLESAAWAFPAACDQFDVFEGGQRALHYPCGRRGEWAVLPMRRTGGVRTMSQ
jgi:hypothetical protein